MTTVLTGGIVTPPSFLPSDITGLNFWVDANSITGLNDGDAVSAWLDKSTNGHNLGSTVGTVTFKTNIINSLPVVRFASNGSMKTSAFNWSTDKGTVFAVFKMAVGGTKVVSEFGATGGNEAGGWSLYKATNNLMIYYSTGSQNTGSVTVQNSTPCCASMIMNKSLATGEVIGYLNGVNSNAVNAPDGNSSGNFGTKELFIGSRNEASLFLDGDIAEIVSYNTALTAEERLQVHSYLSDKWGIGYVGYIDTISENAYPQPFTNGRSFVYGSPHSGVIYTTDATSVIVDSYCDNYIIHPTFSEIGVAVNGVIIANINHTANNYKQTTVNLGTGAGKTVQIFNGYHSESPSSYRGTYVGRVQFNASATRVTPTSSPKMFIFGDSISAGASATYPSSGSWVPIFRLAWSGSIINDAWAGRNFTDACGTAGARTTYAAFIASFAPTEVWIQVSTNDYANNTISAANFETAYADLLDKIHANLPAAVIYAQTAIIRSTETANGSGNTTDDYRTAISRINLDTAKPSIQTH